MYEDPRAIVAEIKNLGDPNAQKRTRAREALETFGPSATWHLIQALDPPGEKTRQEALRALVHRKDPVCAHVFAEHLEDEDSVCRWLAAEGLVALGEDGLRQALRLLAQNPGTNELLQGLHHVLSGLRTTEFHRIVDPVLRAFHSTAREIELQTTASEALSRLGKSPQAPTHENAR